MIIVHFASAPPQPGRDGETAVIRKQLAESDPIPAGALWIDMFQPTAEEDLRVERFLGVSIPTRADPDYTEPPEAHYLDSGVRYLHARVVAEPDRSLRTTGATFVLAGTALVTVRYREVDAFTLFSEKFCKANERATTPEAIAAGLVTTAINRSARALSKVGAELDAIAAAIFRTEGDRNRRNEIYSRTLKALGQEDEKVSNLRESLVSIERLLLFMTAEGRVDKAANQVREATKSALRDLQSLEEDASFKAQKIQFLLDATLGLINLAQNDIIKLFSVLAVIFMPPTLVASIYGMNFKHMPELDFAWGYPLALVAMVCGAIGPYLFFRLKRWL